jgi:glycine cleavage system H protein
MSTEIPEDHLYTESHEYIAVVDDVGTLGLTQYAVTELNEIIYLELPEAGDEVRAGEPFGSVEAVKAVFDLNSPVTGEVIEVNEAAVENPQIVTDDPYEKGWLVRVRISDPDELDNLMNSDAYQEHCESEAH